MDWSTVALFVFLASIAAALLVINLFYRIVMRIIRSTARSTQRTVAVFKHNPYNRR